MKECLATLLLMASTACGVQDATALTNDSYTALTRGDHQAALHGFEAVLARIDASHASYKRAKMGSIEAQIHIEPEAAQASFLAFAVSNSALVSERDYCSVGSKLVAAGEFLDAVIVLDAGVEEFGQTDDLLGALGAAKEASASERWDELGLDWGYL